MSILVPTADLWLPKRPAIIRPEAWWRRAWAVGHSLLGPLLAPGGAPPAAGGGLEFVGAASGNLSASLTALSGGLASAPSEGDLVIGVYADAVGSDQDIAPTTASYAELVDIFSSDNLDVNFWVGWKLMGSTPDTSLVFPSASQSQVAIVHVWRGADQSTPIDVTTTTVTQADTALANPPSNTPVTPGAVILACGGAGVNSSRIFTTNGLDNFFEENRNDGSRFALAAISSYAGWTSGAYNPAAFGLSSSDSTTWAAAAATVVIRPA